MSRIDRREFIRNGLFVAGGLAVPGLLAACTKSSGPKADATLQDVLNGAGGTGGLQIFLGGDDYVAGIKNRLPVGLVDAAGNPIVGQSAKVWLGTGFALSAKAIGPFTAPWTGYAKPDQSPAPQGVNALDFVLDQPGSWQFAAVVDAGGKPLHGVTTFTVKAKSSTRLPGEKAIASLTPTLDNHAGVNPICTRAPACDMHKVTLAKALTLGKPTAFAVGTPKFCQSRTCGPNLEELIIIEGEVGDRASFVHAEVYKDDKPETITRQIASPTFTEWGFQSEPWLFLIDKTGTIVTRFEGPVTAETIRPALQSLLA